MQLLTAASGTFSGNISISNNATNGTENPFQFQITGTVGTLSSPLIVDNASSSVTIVGAWAATTSTSGYYGSNYLNDENSGKGTKSVQSCANLPYSGLYQVFARWPAGSNRATNVPIDIASASGTTTVTVNQQLNNNVWVSLGTYSFAAGTAGFVKIRNTGTNGYVIADAVEFVPLT